MAWYSVYDSNTTSDFAATRAPVGALSILVNKWQDVLGAVYSTASGNLSAISSNNSIPFLLNVLARPSLENTTDMRMVNDVPIGALSSSSVTSGLVLRWNGFTGSTGGSSFAGYICNITTTNFNVFKRNTGGSGSTLGTQSFTYNAAHAYQMDCSVIGNTITYILIDLTTSTTVNTITVTDSSSPYTSGGFGMDDLNGTSTGTSVMSSRIQTFNSAQMTPSVSAGNTSASTTVTLTGLGTTWTSGTTFSISLVSGVTIVTNSVNAGAQTASVTITASTSIGNCLIANSTDPATCVFTIITAVTNYAPNSSGFAYNSLNNWQITSLKAITTDLGYFDFWGTFTSGVLNLDTSNLGSGSLYLSYSIDGGVWVDTNISGLSTLTFASGVSNTLHKVRFWYKGRESDLDSWNIVTTAPIPALIITGITTNAGSTSTPPTEFADEVMFIGDSRVCAWNNIGVTSTAISQDSKSSIASFIADGLKCKCAMICMPGIDLGISISSVPGIDTSYSSYYSGASRLTSGLFNSQPKYIVVLDLGINGRAISSGTYQTKVVAFMTALRAAAPNAIIIYGRGSFDNYHNTDVDAAFATYQLATPDTNLYLLTYGLTTEQVASIQFGNITATRDSLDGVHPTTTFAGRIATILMKSIQIILTSPPVSSSGGSGSLNF